MRPAGMTDSAAAIARDAVAEIGRGPALAYMLGKMLGAASWHRAVRAGQLAVAVLFARPG